MIYVSSISQANGSIRTSPECVRDVLSCHRQRESVCESPPGRQLRETRIPSPLCWPWVGLENARLVAQCLEVGVTGPKRHPGKLTWFVARGHAVLVAAEQAGPSFNRQQRRATCRPSGCSASRPSRRRWTPKWCAAPRSRRSTEFRQQFGPDYRGGPGTDLRKPGRNTASAEFSLVGGFAAVPPAGASPGGEPALPAPQPRVAPAGRWGTAGDGVGAPGALLGADDGGGLRTRAPRPRR